MLTQAELQDVLRYEPSTGIFIWKRCIHPSKIGIQAGGLHKYHGYRIIGVDGEHYPAHRLAWLYAYGAWPPDEIDHINGDRDDNRLSNLRLATSTENARNSKLSRRNTSGHKGVRWAEKRSKWEASIRVDRKLLFLGRHDKLEDALAAYAKAADKHFGEYVRRASLDDPR